MPVDFSYLGQTTQDAQEGDNEADAAFEARRRSSGMTVVRGLYSTQMLSFKRRSKSVDAPRTQHDDSEVGVGDLLADGDFNKFHPRRQRLVAFFLMNSYYGNATLALIVMNCVALAAIDPTDTSNSTKRNQALRYIEYVFTVIFAFEAALRISAQGLYQYHFSYLRDKWNIVDLLIVILSTMTMLIEFAFNEGATGVSALRAFRVLRPLRAVSKLKSLQIIITVLLRSLGQLADVLLLFSMFVLLTGTIAVQIWSGKLTYRCLPDDGDDLANLTRVCSVDASVSHGYHCPYGYDCTPAMNPNYGKTSFDNIGMSALTIFTMVTMEGWVTVMYAAMDASSDWAAIFFVAVLLVGAFFIANLTLVTINTIFFQTQMQIECEQCRTNAQSLFVSRGSTAPDSSSGEEDATRLEAIVRSKAFSTFITLTIVLNTIILAAVHYPPNETLEAIDEVTNIIFTVIFVVEMVFKVVALTPRVYVRDKANVFDAAVSLLALLDLVVVGQHVEGLASISVLRALRLLRVLKLLKQFPELWNTLSAILASLSGVWVLSMLLLLIMVVYAQLGMHLFGGRFCGLQPEGYIYSPSDYCADLPRSNFDHLGWSFVTVFQIITGEEWTAVMYNGMRAGSGSSALYFVSLFVIGNYIVLNLFIAVLINNSSFSPETTQAPLKCNPTGPSYGEEPHDVVCWVQDKSAKDSGLEDDLRTFCAAHPGLCEVLAEYGWGEEGFQDKPLSLIMLNELKERLREVYPPGYRALFCVSSRNTLRRWLVALVEHIYFEVVVILLIMLSAVSLAMYSPYAAPDQDIPRALDTIDLVLTICFSVEAFLKTAAYGFLLHPTAYLRRDFWNKLDFAIVVLSLVAYFVSGASQVGVFRIIRTLRPLRFINKSSGMKLVIGVLMSSLSPLLHIGLVMGFFFVIFAILGVHFFKGAFYACSDETWGDVSTRDLDPITTSADCLPPYRWENAPSHFDNLGAALITLFEMSTLEGWIYVMFLGMDATGPEHAPSKNSQPFLACYFIIFIVMGSFFIVNLFIGVLIEQYNQAKDKIQKEQYAGLSSQQRLWVLIQDVVLDCTENAMKVQIRDASSPFVRAIVSNKNAIEKFITVVVVLNTVIMSTEHAGQPESYTTLIETFNTVFVGVYTIEAGLKLAAYGLSYFRESWNKFDFFIVMVSILGVILDSLDKSTLRFLRVLRMFRLARVIRTAQGVKDLLRTLWLSFPNLINVAALLSLIYFLYAVIGVTQFGRIQSGNCLGEHASFKTFGEAVLLLFRMSTGEDWQCFMSDCSVAEPYCSQQLDGCGSRYFAVLYFVTFMVLVMYVLLNVLIAIILSGFETVSDEMNAPLTHLEMDAFLEEWMKRDPERTWRLDSVKIPPLLAACGPPLGYYVPRCAATREWNRAKRVRLAGLLEEDAGHQVGFRGCVGALCHALMLPLDTEYPEVVLLFERLNMYSENAEWKGALSAIEKRWATLRIVEGGVMPVAQTFAALKVQAVWRGWVVRKRRPPRAPRPINVLDKAARLSVAVQSPTYTHSYTATPRTLASFFTYCSSRSVFSGT